MRPQTAYVSRRNTVVTSNSWGKNHNIVRQNTTKPLGMLSYMAIMGLIVLFFGLVYVAQGTQATNYDYELSGIESEITELEAKREDLAVERARLTSITTAESSTVASSMEDGAVADYVNN